MSSTDQPQPDQIEGAPHPRETRQLLGQSAAQGAFLDAFSSGRLHHGWLITGPKGVGKATLAWQIARFLLATPPAQDDGLFGAPPPPDSLDISPDHPVARRILAQSEPGLFHITRSYNDKTKKLRDQIVADDVRRLNGFLQMSAADGGRRVVIIDSADEMNTQAANALLKMLEEPPARTTLLLISHQPSRLLPTIRSRCRELRLHTLPPEVMAQALDQAQIIAPTDPSALAALAALAAGSVGEAIRLINLDGLAMYAELVALYSGLPRLDRSRAVQFANAAAGASAARQDLLFHLNDLFLARLARCGALGQPPSPAATDTEAQLMARLAPNAQKARAWAELAQAINARITHGRAVNLDPASLLLDTVFRMQKTAT